MTTKPNEPEGLCALCGHARHRHGSGYPATCPIIPTYRAPTQPVADAGGVTEDDVIGLINIVTDLAEVDALDKAYPEVWGRLEAMVNHAVAAATAAKDAEIARLREALTYFANRPTVSEVMDGKHDPMPDTVEARIEEMGRRKREHDDAILQARAALSEAREVGAKD
ncbi:hypothetical protein [Sphingobium sp.]|uniref:hypothetical protein n=1 Tax=Sphingobium sp. TaxID=1912891 RepID=UPI00257AB809|nr:hypothetical protein [Sphingobium sp.]MBR2268495.1 hypothetical protein [Sphingobium sp.]